MKRDALKAAAGILAVSVLSVGCGKANSNSSDGAGSDVATSVVSGAMNNTGGGNVAYNDIPMAHSKLARLLDELNPLRPAYAMSFSCSGGSLLGTGGVSYAGHGSAADPYTYTPLSCTMTWANGKTASATWNSVFTVNYGATCDNTHPLPWSNTGGGCTVTRTTATGGNTRTFTGPRGNSFAVDHDTNGAGTGWDSSVSPAPNSNGVVVTCGASGCADASGSHTLVINGSHVTGTIDGTELFDHTVTGTLSVQGSGTGRTVNGSITVQHNLAKFTSTATFSNVVYGEAGCCFPTSGEVTTTVKGGGNESLAFSSVCGEATLTKADGSSEDYTLQHCL
jgi:hypothetical protein